MEITATKEYFENGNIVPQQLTRKIAKMNRENRIGMNESQREQFAIQLCKDGIKMCQEKKKYAGKYYYVTDNSVHEIISNVSLIDANKKIKNGAKAVIVDVTINGLDRYLLKIEAKATESIL